ncbi:hypothetical protein IAR55_006513 [Kwoniella newhampshirensis]|uniref:Rab-GAP TBC domain-containing protein n=1 Tax=Kwoniella newhampshirensis TaxID=1651941 RepID=A0AAW0YU59_9TREE
MLETLPPEKLRWKSTLRDQRQRYYVSGFCREVVLTTKSLVQTFMEELESRPSTSTCTFDYLLRDIAKDVRRLKSSFWRGRTKPHRSSPLRPISNAQRSGTHTSSDEESSSSEPESSLSILPPPLQSRRALFKRIDTLAEAEHRGGYGPVSAKSQETDSVWTSPDPTMLSPKITLSIDPSPISSRLDSRRPPPLDTSGLQPANDPSKPSSPITLLSPKPLPDSSQPTFSTSLSGSLFHPDTHLEALIRLLYTFCRTNPQWRYQPSFIDTAATLYLIYTGGKKIAMLHGEEQTFWALTAMVGEIDGIVDDEGMSLALDRMTRRLAWANRPFVTILKERNLETTLYAYRWLSFCFTRDLASHSITPLWDFLLSETPSTPGSQPKVDLLIDIAVAMVMLLKEQLLAPPRHSAVSGLWESELLDEDNDAALVRCLGLLRSYPLQSVGGIRTILQAATELREDRLGAVRSGTDPDETMLPQAVDPVPVVESSISALSWSRVAGSLWNSISPQATPSPEPVPTPSTPRRTLENLSRQPSHQRDRSDSGVSSVSSIQERLANLTSPFHIHRTPPPLSSDRSPSNSFQTPLPRPLLLSGSARRASRSGRRDSSPIPSPRTSPPNFSNDTRALSPPATVPSPSKGPSLYRIGSRQRSSLGASPTAAREIRRDLDYGETTPQ